MVRAVQDVADTHRYDVMIANTDHMLDGEKHFVESVIRRPVDGVIMVPYHLTDDDLDELMAAHGRTRSRFWASISTIPRST